MNFRKLLVIILLVLIAIIIALTVVLFIRKCTSSNTSLSSKLPDLDGAKRIELGINLNAKNNVSYGINVNELIVETGRINDGETFSMLLNNKFDVNIAIINKLIEKSENVYDLRNMRSGYKYAAFTADDSLHTLKYLVYERNPTQYVTFAIGDSVYVKLGEKNVVTKERYVEGTIEGSLSQTLYSKGVSASLTLTLADIYQSTIDFFAIQKGDKFKVLYQEQLIDTVSVGIGKIYGVEFTHRGVPYIAVGFEQGESAGYWDEKGHNLKKAFLRAPLNFKARVSSRYGMRTHPIRRTRQKHNGVDYAAPTGTPVIAIADGTVSRKYWDRLGGGNTMWVKHSRGIEAGYLHLSRYAKGIAPGVRVRKGQVIAYVGNTGMSTGPHLDFRVKVHGKYINPDKLPTTPGPPITKTHEKAFMEMKDDVLKAMAEYHAKNNPL